MSGRDGRAMEGAIGAVGSEGEEGVTTPPVPEEDIKSLIDSKVEELRSSIRDAVQDALANVLGDLLEEKEEEESKQETEAEELPSCPKNPLWLRRMFELLPEDILKNSKLWRYRRCVLAVKEAEKEADQ